MLLDVQREALIRRVRETLEANHVIAVMGWRSNHHTLFTKGLSERRVKFYNCDNPPKCLGPTVGLILCAEYANHSHTERIKDSRMYSVVVHYHVIIHILETCTDFLTRPCSPTAHDPPHVVATEPTVQTIPAVEIDDAVLDFLTVPREEKHMSTIQEFAEAFLTMAAANKRKPGYVGKMDLSKLRKEHAVEQTTQDLVRSGWLVGEVGKGKTNIGWYKPGREMLVAEKEKPEPADPYELAKFLIAQKPDLLVQIDEINTKLARIEIAEKALKQLDDL